MAQIAIDTSHGCHEDAKADGDLIPVHQAARSSCHGAVLAEGGTPETGFTCTECGQPCDRVLGQPTAHWTCHPCGTRRSQVITQPVDEAV